MAHHVSIIKHGISLICAVVFMCFTSWFSHTDISLHSHSVELVSNVDDALATDPQFESDDDAAHQFLLTLNNGLCCEPSSELLSFFVFPKRYSVAVGRAPPPEFIS